MVLRAPAAMTLQKLIISTLFVAPVSRQSGRPNKNPLDQDRRGFQTCVRKEPDSDQRATPPPAWIQEQQHKQAALKPITDISTYAYIPGRGW